MSTLYILPTSDSDIDSLSRIASSGGYYDKVDEEIGSENTADYIYDTSSEGAAATGYAKFGMADHGAESGTINWIKVWWYAQYNGDVDSINYVKPYCNNQLGSQQNVTSSWAWYSQQYMGDPNDGDAAWDWDKIDALVAGVYIAVTSDVGKGDNCSVIVACCVVEVDYTESALGAFDEINGVAASGFDEINSVSVENIDELLGVSSS